MEPLITTGLFIRCRLSIEKCVGGVALLYNYLRRARFDFILWSLAEKWNDGHRSMSRAWKEAQALY